MPPSSDPLSLSELAALAASLLLTAVIVFQILLAAGLPLGAAAWGGRHRVLPPKLRWGSLASIPVLAAAAWAILARAGLAVPGSGSLLVRIGAWAFAGLFVLNSVGNLASASPAERRLMTPVTLLLAAAFVLVALS